MDFFAEMKVRIMKLSISILSAMLSLDFYCYAECYFAKCYYDECHGTFLKALLQGILAEREGSIQLTTLYQQD
jgi:hypothetical protein